MSTIQSLLQSKGCRHLLALYRTISSDTRLNRAVHQSRGKSVWDSETARTTCRVLDPERWAARATNSMWGLWKAPKISPVHSHKMNQFTFLYSRGKLLCFQNASLWRLQRAGCRGHFSSPNCLVVVGIFSSPLQFLPLVHYTKKWEWNSFVKDALSGLFYIKLRGLV